MKKILFVSNAIQEGGATKSLFYLANTLKNDFEPIILVTKKGYLTDMCDKNNIKYLILNYKPFLIDERATGLKKIIKRILRPLLKLRYIICNKISLNKIDKLINMEEISLIHTNVNRDDFGALLSKKFNIPHIWHLREFGDLDYKCYSYRKNYIKFMNENTKYFIAISNAVKNHFVTKGINKDKIKVIYNGVKINNNPKINENKNLNILFMGGIQESKGQHELIEALNLIPKEISKNIKVDFYGTSVKDYKNLLINKINEYNLQNITFHDYINNIDNIMSNYNVGIMCSKSEAFGRVIVEYMANKLITIVPNRGACPEIVSNGTGFVYKYGDYDDLSNIIIKIYKMNFEERKEIFDKGYERAKLNFSAEKNAENIIKLYEKILK